MRIGHVSAAIGLPAIAFAGSLVCAPAGEPLQPGAAHLDGLTVNKSRNYHDQLIAGQQAGDRERPLLAQANYDCWIMMLPKPEGEPRSAECRQRFLQALEGWPDKHRGIFSVESRQLAAVAVSAPARGSGDSIGALILSLSPPGRSRPNSAHDFLPASIYAVGRLPVGGQVMSDCDANCLASSFSGPATASNGALIDRDRNFRGPGDSNAGQQSANAGGTSGSSGNSGQGNNGPGNNNSGGGVDSGGSGSGSAGSGSPGGGSSGSGGPGGPGSGGPGSGGSGDGPGGGDSGDGGDGGPGNGNGGGNGHGHGHGHGGGG